MGGDSVGDTAGDKGGAEGSVPDLSEVKAQCLVVQRSGVKVL